MIIIRITYHFYLQCQGAGSVTTMLSCWATFSQHLFSMPWVTEPPPLLPHCTLFQWGPLCVKTCNIFLETFLCVCQRVDYILAWEVGKMALYYPYVASLLQIFGMRVKAAHLKETQCCTATHFPKSGWLLSCTFPRPSRSEAAFETPFQVFNPHVCFAESFCSCRTFGFLRHSRGDFCLGSVLLRRRAA